MPFLYESRQHKRSGRESLDCALALEELVDMGVENIITFDAHDPRVQNAIPLKGFETVQPIYQFIKYLLKNEKELEIDSDHMMVISPDEGGMSRAVFFSNVLGLDMGMFYKRRDYTRIVNGRNPIVAHEFLGSSVEGKDVLIVEDIIDSGQTLAYLIEVLKQRNPKNIELCTLLDKPERRVKKQVKVDYTCFTIPDEFVVGYGLDYDQKYRNLPFIGVVEQQ